MSTGSSNIMWKRLLCTAALCASTTHGARKTSHWSRPRNKIEHRVTTKPNNLEAVQTPGVERSLNEARIVGGSNAPPGRYKVQIACYTSRGDYGCGASLIAPNVALSAAHCYRNCETIKVNLRNRTDGSVREHKVVEKVRHPMYGRGFPGNRYDIMLMKIDEVISLTPMMLLDDASMLKVGSDVTVTGWGSTEEGGSPSMLLKEVQLKYLDNDRCREDYGSRVTDDMLCAHISGGGKDACQGDSGSPLMIKGKDYKTDVQVGVVSWGFGCARPEYAGVYCRITESIDWIQMAMKKQLKVSPSSLRLFTTSGSNNGGSTPASPRPSIVTPKPKTKEPLASPEQLHNNTKAQATNDMDSKVSEVVAGIGSASPPMRKTSTTLPPTTEEIVPLAECKEIFEDKRWSWTPKCEDLKSFTGSLGNQRDCEWVRSKRDRRCKKDHARYCCPETCNACNDHV